MRFRRVRSWVRRSLRGLQLLPAVGIAVTGGVAIVLLATLILDRLIHTSSKAADPIDITKLSFTVAGGVGAAVALVVAYRRQRDIEQGRFVERFGAAAAQLGDHDVAVRIAGVYAMAGVADESAGLRRQQCIDVLCGYLRLPYSSELGSNHQSKLVLTEARTGEDGSSTSQEERHLEFRQNDKEVRATIVRVIGDHLRDHEYTWSTCDFDFRTTQLEDVDLSQAVFGGTTRFNDVTFAGDADFYGAKFSGDVEFDGATFFSTSSFEEVTFSGPTSFEEVAFIKTALFSAATFSGVTSFNGATFTTTAGFDGATFSSTAKWGATFFGTAAFNAVTFCGDARFYGANFSRLAAFNKAKFSGDIRFGGATFSGDTRFEAATFSGPTSFRATNFGSGQIAFDDPHQWGPPAPTFGWDDHLSTKPENVTPQNWPPTPVARFGTNPDMS